MVSSYISRVVVDATPLHHFALSRSLPNTDACIFTIKCKISVLVMFLKFMKFMFEFPQSLKPELHKVFPYTLLSC